MLNLFKRKFLKGQSFGWLLIILAWSLTMGWLLALSMSAQGDVPPIGTVDVVPENYQFGKKSYLDNCSTCHIALPPEVFPSETWRDILQDSQHYGAQNYQALVDPYLTAVQKYLYRFSRLKAPDEQTPYSLNHSRYFLALHPGVKLPIRIETGVEMSLGTDSCITCHPGSKEFNFRSLTPEQESGG